VTSRASNLYRQYPQQHVHIDYSIGLDVASGCVVDGNQTRNMYPRVACKHAGGSLLRGQARSVCEGIGDIFTTWETD